VLNNYNKQLRIVLTAEENYLLGLYKAKNGLASKQEAIKKMITELVGEQNVEIRTV
jgi:hypothetical protein